MWKKVISPIGLRLGCFQGRIYCCGLSEPTGIQNRAFKPRGGGGLTMGGGGVGGASKQRGGGGL